MNTKAVLIALGVIIVAVIVILAVKPKNNATVTPVDQSATPAETTPSTPVNTQADVTATDTTTTPNPAFPATGFAPVQ